MLSLTALYGERNAGIGVHGFMYLLLLDGTFATSEPVIG